MDQDKVLEIILSARDEEVAVALEALSDEAFSRESAGFDGLDTITVTFTAIGAPLIAAVTTIVVEQIRARKHIKVRYGKTTIEGVSEQKVLELLERLSRDGEK